MSTSKKQSKKSEQASIIDQLDAKSKKQVSPWIDGIGDFLNVDKEESQAILERLFKAFLDKGKSNKRNAGRKSRERKDINLLFYQLDQASCRIQEIEKLLVKFCGLLEMHSQYIANLVGYNGCWGIEELQEWEERLKEAPKKK